MIASTLSRRLNTPRGPTLWRNSSLENPAMSLNDPATWDAFTAGSKADSGVEVTTATAINLAPVWQAISIISGDVAMCPLNVYLRLANDDREIDRNHEAQYLLTVQANEEMSAFEMWRRGVAHALLWGNAYVYIGRTGRVGRPISLINLLPDRTAAGYGPDGKLFYETITNGKRVPLDPAEVIHIKGVSFENGAGKNLVDAARQTLGLALAAQGFAGRFFANGAQAGGMLELPPSITPKAKANLEEGFEKKYTGKDNWFKVVILRDGAKFHQTTIDAENSQLTETREADVRDVARYFNLPGFKLNIADSVSYNSSEQGQLAYKTGCLSHWFAAVRTEVAIKLLSQADLLSGARFVEHNSTKLIETDTKTTNEVLEIQRRNQIISANEWRRKINLNARPDGGGDEYLNPNTTAGGAPPEPPDDDAPEADMGPVERAMLADVVGRMARRISLEARKHAGDPERFGAWTEQGLTSLGSMISQAAAPCVLLLSATTGRSVVAVGEQFRDGLIDRAWEAFAPLFGADGKLIRPESLAADVESACAGFEATIMADMALLMTQETDDETGQEQADD